MLSIRFKDGMGQIMRGIYQEVISEHWHIFKRTVRMPEDISKQFRKKISLKEFEVTNTANSGGEEGRTRGGEEGRTRGGEDVQKRKSINPNLKGGENSIEGVKL